MNQLTNESRYTTNTAWLEPRGAATWLRVLVPLFVVALIALLAAYESSPSACSTPAANDIELRERCAAGRKARTEVGSGPLSGLSLQAL